MSCLTVTSLTLVGLVFNFCLINLLSNFSKWFVTLPSKNKLKTIRRLCVHVTLGSERLFLGASLVAQMVKRLSAMQETQIRSLGWEDPLEKEMAAHPSVLAWKIPWTEEPGGP